MAPRRIALLIHSLDGGGAERLMTQLANRWCQQGHEIHLTTWSTVETDRYGLNSNVHRYGLDLMRQSRGPVDGLLANLTRIRRLRGHLKSIKPSFILSFADQMNILALEASRRLQVPIWISEHSDPSKQRLSSLWEYWRARSYPRCSGCVVLTTTIAAYMRRWVSSDIVVIPPAIDPPSIPELKEHGDSSGLRQFLYVGRLSLEKGPDLLLQAWARVVEQLAEWEMVIVGDGPMREAMQRDAQSLHRVRCLGWKKDIWPFYQNASAFVLPSRYEGFPIALLEAMSQGVPSITTRCTSAIDALTEQGELTGLATVAPGDVEALANAMLKTASANPSDRVSAGRGLQKTARRYLWDQIGPQWDTLLDR